MTAGQTGTGRTRAEAGTPGHGANGQGGARVILVGRTGLDGALRLDPGFELLRARTAMDAIGELADPIDGSSPRAAVVLVAAEADPGERAGAFIESLRIVDPDVRVAIVGGGTRGVYDAALAKDAEPEAVRAAVRALSAPAPVNGNGAAHGAGTGSNGTHIAPAVTTAVAPARGPEQQPPHQPAAQPVAAGARAEQSEPDDLSLLDAALAGRDLLLPALAIIRRRVGCGDVAFQEQDSETGMTSLCLVQRNGRTFGGLSSPSLAASGRVSALEPHAEWLARWLAIREQHAQLRHAAFTDELTGAFNRRYFDRYLSAAIDEARTHRTAVTVLYFDIDDFKQYNDKFGHSAGDDILRETVRLLSSVIRPTDRVCRIGGDEFAVVFHGSADGAKPAGDAGAGAVAGTPNEKLDNRGVGKPPTSIWEIAQRFQRQICEHRFPKLAEQAPGTLTISGGLAAYPWDGSTPAALLDRADELALESKRQGKNAITIGQGAARVCHHR